MIHTLQLNQPIFADACNYGHFTRANLPWEQTGQAGKFAELCAQLITEMVAAEIYSILFLW